MEDKQRWISLYLDSRGTTLVTFDIVFPSVNPSKGPPAVLKNLAKVKICARFGFAFSAGRRW